MSKWAKRVLAAVMAVILICGIAAVEMVQAGAVATTYTKVAPLKVPRIRQEENDYTYSQCVWLSMASVEAYCLKQYTYSGDYAKSYKKTPYEYDKKGEAFFPKVKDVENKSFTRYYEKNGAGVDYTAMSDPVYMKIKKVAEFNAGKPTGTTPELNGSSGAAASHIGNFPVPLQADNSPSLLKIYNQLKIGRPVVVFRGGSPNHASVVIAYNANSDTLVAKDFTVMEIKVFGGSMKNSLSNFNQYAGNPQSPASGVSYTSLASCYVTLQAWLNGNSLKSIYYPKDWKSATSVTTTSPTTTRPATTTTKAPGVAAAAAGAALGAAVATTKLTTTAKKQYHYMRYVSSSTGNTSPVWYDSTWGAKKTYVTDAPLSANGTSNATNPATGKKDITIYKDSKGGTWYADTPYCY